MNENKIDSTIEKLLEQTENKYLKKSSSTRIVNKILKDGRNFEIHSSLDSGYTIGDKVTIDGELPIDGEYSFGCDSLLVADGKLKRL